jgi:hypothetical protein
MDVPEGLPEGMGESPMVLDGNVHFSICQQKDDIIALWRDAYQRLENEHEMIKAENRSLKSHMKAMKAEHETRARWAFMSCIHVQIYKSRMPDVIQNF